MAAFDPIVGVTQAVDTRYLVAWEEGRTIGTMFTGDGTIAVLTASAENLQLTYLGQSMTGNGTVPTGGTFNTISYEFGTTTQGILSGISPAANFADITTINAYRIFDGSDTINGTAFANDFLFAGYGGNDVLDGKGGGDNFEVSLRATTPVLTIKGQTGVTDTLYVVKNIYDTSANVLDLSASTLTSINAITLDPGSVVIIDSSQLGAGISAGAVIGATSGTAIFDVNKNLNVGTLDLQGKLDVNPNTTLRIFGTGSAETLSGTDRADTFYGRAGSDTLNGRGGNDTFYLEGAGDEFDTINGGSGTDTVRVTGSTMPVLNGFNAKASSIEAWFSSVSGNAGDNTFDFRGLSDAPDDLSVYGADGDDTIMVAGSGFFLSGDEGNDTLIGGNGEDIFLGGPGADGQTGGGSTDLFAYTDVKDSGPKKSLRDTITDFKAKSDTIWLLIDANTSKNDFQFFKFVKKEGAAFKSKPGSVIWEQIDKAGTAKDMTVVYADNNGDQKADMAIQLKGLVDLKAGDFFFGLG